MGDLNPGLKPNEIVSPDNLHTEPIPSFVDNSVPVELPDEPEEEATDEKPKRVFRKSKK